MRLLFYLFKVKNIVTRWQKVESFQQENDNEVKKTLYK